jgi:hypothetical protein
VKKLAKAQVHGKGGPVAVVIGLAEVKAFKFVSGEGGTNLKTLNAPTSLEAAVKTGAYGC